MRFAIIGCGRAGRRHAQQFASISDAELVANYDPCAKTADAFARDFGTKAFSDIQTLLNQPLDAVTVCSPPSTHVPIVSEAIRRGMRVLCEKPLATRTESCLDIPNTRELACAFKFRHLVGARPLREMIFEGELGRILAIRGTAVSNVDMSESWFSNPLLAGGGVLFDNGVHLIDLCSYLVGPIESVSASICGGTRDLHVEESGTIQMRMTTGVAANLLLSWEAPAPMPPILEIYGSAGFARLGYDLEVFNASGERVHHMQNGKTDIWHEVISNFVSFVGRRDTPSATFEDGFHAVAAAEAAYRSLDTGAWERPRSIVEYGQARTH